MQSRVFSRATAFAPLPYQRKPSHRENGAVPFVSARPIGAVSEGGNLIWGRQLRPALLLEASPMKREILRPCKTAASSPAEGDSAGDAKVAPIGFFGKYPFILTGFFFFMWYFLNVIFNIMNKKIYNYFPYPYFVSVVHLGVGVVYCLISWAVGLPKRAPIDANLLKLLIPVAVCHALGHVTSNVSFAAVAVSFTHTIKALEPFFNAAASQFVLGQSIPLSLWLSLAPVVLGVSMASLTELSFNWLGFISAMISNISFTYRSIYSKKAMTDMDSTNLYAYISIIALFVCIPPALIVEGPQLIKYGFNDAIAKVGLVKFVTDLFWVGLFYHLYNQLATNTLERVAPLTHAVGNVLKRVFVIGFSIVIFGNKISTQTGIGTIIAIAGAAPQAEALRQQKMATMPPSSLQLPNPFPLTSSSTKPHSPKPFFSFATRATDPETPPSEPSPESGSGPDDFDSKLSQVRLRYRSGTGKKAEIRKTKKSKSGSGSSSASNLYLPPVPLKEPVSGGLKVDFGFSPYSERLNGRIAILGLTALLLVELATGKSVLKYHTPSVVLVQVYFVAAVAAVYIKYEKEKVSVWPQSAPPKE